MLYKLHGNYIAGSYQKLFFSLPFLNWELGGLHYGRSKGN